MCVYTLSDPILFFLVHPFACHKPEPGDRETSTGGGGGGGGGGRGGAPAGVAAVTAGSRGGGGGGGGGGGRTLGWSCDP